MKTENTLVCLMIIPSLFFFCCRKKEPAEISRDANRFPVETAFEGRIVFQSNMDGDNEIYLLTPRGVMKLTDNTWSDEYPVWSPDGKRIAFTANPKGNFDIFVMNDDGGAVTQVTTSPDNESDPAWFPDGTSVAYALESERLLRNMVALFKMDLGTKTSERILPKYGRIHAIPHISPVSPLLTFTGKRPIGWDAAVANWETGEVKFLEEEGKSCRARFSKDGSLLAYVTSRADGKGDIWQMNPDGTGKRRLTERDDTYDYFPSWSPDGRFIVFNTSQQHDLEGDWSLAVVEVRTGKMTPLYNSPGNDIFPDWH